MSYSWESITGQPTQGLIGSTISSNVPYFCGSNTSNNAYAVQGVGFTPVLTSATSSTAFTDMEISNSSYFLCGFNYVDENTSYAYLANQMTNYFSTYEAAMYAIAVKQTDVVSVGRTSTGNALIVKTTTDTFANPFITPYYNSNAVATALFGVDILSNGTIISVGGYPDTNPNPVILANAGSANIQATDILGTYFSVTTDSSDNIYACGITILLGLRFGFVDKYTYSSGVFTRVWRYTDTSPSLYTSITLINSELYVSGGNGADPENCNPYILKLDTSRNLILTYTGTQAVKIIGDVKSNSISVDSTGKIYSIYMPVPTGGGSDPRNPILIVGTPIVCVLRDTPVLTAEGYVKIQDLTENSRVIGAFTKNPIAVKSVVRNTVGIKDIPTDNLPYRIPKDFFADNTPSLDLFFSGYHGVILHTSGTNFMIPTYLIPGLERATDQELEDFVEDGKIDYYHVELEESEGFIAGNVHTESLNLTSKLIRQ